MAALIDMTTGKPAIAYTNEVPWHGMGTRMLAQQTLDQWREAAGLDWSVKETPVLFRQDDGELASHAERKVLYRSDTQAPLSVVGSGYQVVQPAKIVDFYEDLCDRHGFAMETMGALRGGKTIWALAKTGVSGYIAGTDLIEAYLLLYTSHDATCATVARFTSVRVVCNNTLTMAMGSSGRAVSTRHSAMFDANKVKLELGVGDVWAKHQATLRALAEVQVTPEQQVSFLLKVYHDLTTKDIKAQSPAVERTMQRLAGILAFAPGAQLAGSQGTAFGLLNAVTYDVDHSLRARTDDSRLSSAWMGAGEARKNLAFAEVQKLLEAA